MRMQHTPRTLYGDDAHWHSFDIHCAQESTERQPILIFVMGGGWSGFEPLNDPLLIPQAACEAGFVCVTMRHRPARVSPVGAAILAYAVVLPALSLIHI